MDLLGSEQEWHSNFTVEQLRGLAFDSIGTRCSRQRLKADLIHHIRAEWAQRLELIIVIQPPRHYGASFADHIRGLAQVINISSSAYNSVSRTSTSVSSVGAAQARISNGTVQSSARSANPTLPKSVSNRSVKSQGINHTLPQSTIDCYKLMLWLQKHANQIVSIPKFTDLYLRAFGNLDRVMMEDLYAWISRLVPLKPKEITAIEDLRDVPAADIINLRTNSTSWQMLKLSLFKLFLQITSGKNISNHKSFIMENGGPMVELINVELIQSMPTFAVGYDGILFKTGYFGLTEVLIDNILVVDKIPLVQFIQLYRDWEVDEARKLAYWIVKSKLNPASIRCNDRTVDREIRADRSSESVNPARYITNLAEIAVEGGFQPAFFRTSIKDLVEIPHLGVGARKRLYQWLDQNPQLYEAIKPRTRYIPYLIEDCIDIKTLPMDLARYFGMVRIPHNPYLLMSSANLERIAHIRDVTTTSSTRALELNELDKVIGVWNPEILNLTPQEMLVTLQKNDRDRARGLLKLAYYCACRGLKIPDYDSEVWTQNTYQRICLAACEFYDAGDGLKTTRDNAIEYSAPFVTRILEANLGNDSNTDKALWCMIFGITEIGLLSRSDIITIFRRGYIRPLPIDQTIYSRYRLYESLTETQQDMIARVYNRPQLTATSFAKLKPLISMENYIKSFTEDSMEYTAEHMGMIFPLKARTHELKREYFIASIGAYVSIARVSYLGTTLGSKTRSYIKKMTDRDILLTLGGQVFYTSRTQLESVASDMFQLGQVFDYKTQHFFIPYKRNARNKRTLTSLEDTNDTSIFLVAFGSCTDYVCHEISELASYLLPQGDNAVYRYAILGLSEKYEPITITQAMELRHLLEDLYPLMRSSDQKEYLNLVDNLDRIHQAITANNLHDRNALQLFRTFRNEVRDVIRRYLYKIFELGMYMRRWRGPGNPYPLEDKETQRRNFDPDDNLTIPVGQTLELSTKLGWIDKSALKFIESLKMVCYKDGQFNQSTIQTMVGVFKLATNSNDEVKMCIRMASAELVGSSYYYISLFFNKLIPGFDPARVDRIT
jgi:hypothetical protein